MNQVPGNYHEEIKKCTCSFTHLKRHHIELENLLLSLSLTQTFHHLNGSHHVRDQVQSLFSKAVPVEISSCLSLPPPELPICPCCVPPQVQVFQTKPTPVCPVHSRFETFNTIYLFFKTHYIKK